jgi:hypothetical protein
MTVDPYIDPETGVFLNKLGITLDPTPDRNRQTHL